ncbi:ATP-binding protein [Vibrio profundum]|uniref:sensor histidine kinase n=1 Tax=Vibrio profundum TaxID=2910247 RepID=UPI003D10E5FB
MTALSVNWTESTKVLFLSALYALVIYIGVQFRTIIIETDTAMLLLLLNIVGGFWLKDKIAYTMTALSIAGFLFFVLPEHNSFKFQNYQHLITFTVMAFNGIFAVKITQSQQGELKKNVALKSELKSHYGLASILASKNESIEIAQSSILHLANHYQIKAQIWLTHPQLYCLSHNPEFWLDAYQTQVEEFVASQAPQSTKLGPNLELHPLHGQTELLGVLVIESDSIELFNPILSSLISLSLARSEANQALTQAIEANQMEKMRNTLLAAVSHDLKTPLGSIIGSATTLNDQDIRLPEETRQELLLSIAEEGYSLNRSLTKLLDISRYSVKVLVPKREWVEPEEIIGSAIKRVERLLREHPIQTSGEPMLVSLDYALIEQVATNLIENAAKYSPQGSQIDITTSYKQGKFIMQIADRGCGVAPEDTQRIFERFYRSEDTNAKGTGLGLAICKVIISAHNGQITVSPRPEGGSTFTVEIPCEIYCLTDIYE